MLSIVDGYELQVVAGNLLRDPFYLMNNYNGLSQLS